MIRIHKPARAPEILQTRGQDETARLCDAYEHGERSFTFDKTLYGAESVKKALRKAQRGKCAFCESRVDHISYGDVEHLRPKAGFVQRDGAPLQQPGYYWLAYAWSNLFLACQLCNQRFKRNLYPLRNPGQRARSHRDDLTRERPLLLDPGSSDPARHIGFRQEIAYPIRGSAEGQTTIDVLGLNRIELVERRRDRLVLLNVLRATIEQYQARQRAGGLSAKELTQLRDLETQAARFREDGAEYSSLARAVFR